MSRDAASNQNPQNLNTNIPEDDPASILLQLRYMGPRFKSSSSSATSRRVLTIDLAKNPGADPPKEEPLYDPLRAGMYDEWFKKNHLGLIEKTAPNPAILSKDNPDLNSFSTESGSKDLSVGNEDMTSEEDQDAVISYLANKIHALTEDIVETQKDLDATNEKNLQLFERYKELKGAQDASKL